MREHRVASPGTNMSHGPNFFIVGGPRCGTSALTHLLAAHPQVFFPGTPEPHYFASDLQLPYRVSSIEDYQTLFADARPHQTARGETGGWYLHSEVAIPAILEFDPAARFIAIVRNPIELVRSLHAHNLAHGIETERELEAAWARDQARRAGRALDAGAAEAQQLRYRWAASLGLPLERAMGIVPKSQLLVIVHDDLQSAPSEIYERLCTFLGLAASAPPRFQRVNAGERVRSHSLQHLLHNPPRALRRAVRSIVRLVGPDPVWALEDRVRRLNRRPGAPPVLSRETRAHLETAFEEDVDRLSSLLVRNLSGWIRA